MKQNYIEEVSIDQCHCDLIYGLIVSHKPQSILELGYGSGTSSSYIIKAIKYNYNYHLVNYIIVDNWMDYDYKKPDINVFGATIITSNEKDYIKSCDKQFDFILSDADHQHTNEWFRKTYELLNDNGVLIYHDVTNKDYPNLYEIVEYCRMLDLKHVVFNKSTLHKERCDRGLLVIMK